VARLLRCKEQLSKEREKVVRKLTERAKLRALGKLADKRLKK
jgi:hypothetical protein